MVFQKSAIGVDDGIPRFDLFTYIINSNFSPKVTVDVQSMSIFRNVSLLPASALVNEPGVSLTSNRLVFVSEFAVAVIALCVLNVLLTPVDT